MLAEAIDALRDDSVKKRFLAVLESNLPAEKKYEEFITFFERYDQLLTEIASQSSGTPADRQQTVEQEVSRAAQTVGLWNPSEILTRVQNGLVRALNRFRASQHRDGGWGYYPEQSVTWGTAHVLMALTKAKQVLDLAPPVGDLIVDAREWLKQHATDWTPYEAPPGGKKSTYEASLAARCLCETGDAGFHAVSATLEWIATNQNVDGGWDAVINDPQNSWPRRVFSEVGATRMAIQALVTAENPTYQRRISLAANWLALVQNADGSWNSGSCCPGVTKPEGQPSISKTCDALQGIYAGRPFVYMPNFETIVHRAVDWIMAQEQLRRSSESGQFGWGYDDPEMPDLDSTCLAMETLVSIPEVSLPTVTANAMWLLDAQYSEPGSIEDGKWTYGDTFRITAALLDYYKKILGDPIFGSR